MTVYIASYQSKVRYLPMASTIIIQYTVFVAPNYVANELYLCEIGLIVQVMVQ